MTKGRVNKLIPFSSVDGPGNRFAIFLQGCNFNCQYCHNPETINNCINCGECIMSCKFGALGLKSSKVFWDKDRCTGCDMCIKTCAFNSSPKVLEYSASEVMEEVDKNIDFIRGVTVSGGECTLQSGFLIELFNLCKKMGLTCFIDINGSIPLWENKELIDLIDGVMLDVKAFSDDDHVNVAGEGNKIVLDNLHYLLSIKKLYEVRTVIIEGLFNCAETVSNVSKIISNSSVIYKLIKYRTFGVREDFKDKWNRSGSPEFLNGLVDICKSNKVDRVIVV